MEVIYMLSAIGAITVIVAIVDIIFAIKKILK